MLLRRGLMLLWRRLALLLLLRSGLTPLLWNFLALLGSWLTQRHLLALLLRLRDG